MSVISTHDATDSLSDDPTTPSASDSVVKPGHLLVEISPTEFMDSSDVEGDKAEAGAPVLDAHHQATIALNVSDVIDLGTEHIDGLDALVINGETGDSVHLANEPGYVWSRVTTEAPEGYQMYQAHLVTDHAQSADMASDMSHQPITVLVQDDLTVILHTS